MDTKQMRVCFGAFIGMTVSAPALASSVPLLLEPTAREFGWGRATISLAYMVAAPLAAISYLFVGRLLDRFGARRILIPGFILCGLSYMLLTQLNGSVTQLLILKTISSLCGTLPTGVAFGNIISRYFTGRRGTVLGLCLGAGGGLGMALLPLLGAFLLESWGWRSTYLGIGLVAVLVGLPAALLLPGNAPDRSPAQQDARVGQAVAPEAGLGMDSRSALRHLAFLLLLATTFLTCMVINGIGAHMAAIMTDHGMTHALAATALSIYAMMMMAGQFGIGILLDRTNTPRIAIPVFTVVLAGVALLHLSSGPVGLFLGAALIGAGAGSEYGILPYFITRFFGVRSFGFLYGGLYAIAALGTGLGPYLMGLSFDLSGRYGIALVAFEITILLVILIVSRFPAYGYDVTGSRTKA